MKTVVFTFDDGIRTHFDLVRPLLKEHGMKGTFFIPGVRTMWVKRMKKIRENDGYDMQEGPLGWHEILQMDEEGFEMGNHTVSHPNMCSKSVDVNRLEVEGMNDQFAANGVTAPETFCYPGYHADKATRGLLASLGFKFARIGYLINDFHRGEPAGGNRPENRTERRYYVPGESDPLLVNSTGILNDWYGFEEFRKDVEEAPEGVISVFTAHGFARKSRWTEFEKMVKYLSDNGHQAINFRDMPLESADE